MAGTGGHRGRGRRLRTLGMSTSATRSRCGHDRPARARARCHAHRQPRRSLVACRCELRAADAIACEDTRRTRALLSHAGVRCPPLIVVNDHTEAASVRDVLRRLDEGQRVAVVSDAGTPGISDPGERLVRAARTPVIVSRSRRVRRRRSRRSWSVDCRRDVSSSRDSFRARATARAARLDALLREERTAIVYEAPHRVLATLRDLAVALGATRRVAIARELTKLHEEVWRGTLPDARCGPRPNRPASS